MTDDLVRSGRAVGLLTITTELNAGEHTIALMGELDLANADAVEAELERAAATDCRSIVLDLSQLEFMDSSGVALLMRATQSARADSNRLAIVRPPERVMRVLHLTGAAELLPFVD